jgi:hypothetical protein
MLTHENIVLNYLVDCSLTQAGAMGRNYQMPVVRMYYRAPASGAESSLIWRARDKWILDHRTGGRAN